MDKYFLPCQFKKMFGIPCPGCGFQRSVEALFVEGNVYKSFLYYPALIPLIVTGVLIFLHLFVKKQKGNALYYLGILDIALIIIHYVLVMINR